MTRIYRWSELLTSEYRTRSVEPGDRLNVYYSVYDDSIKFAVNSTNGRDRGVLRIFSRVYPAPTEVEANGWGWPRPKHVPAGTLVFSAQYEVENKFLFAAESLGLDGTSAPRYVCAHERYANQIWIADYGWIDSGHLCLRSGDWQR